MDNGEQVFNAAITAQLSGDIAEAEELYDLFLADHPQRDDAHFGLGILCLNSGRKDDAVRHFERALFLCPGNVDYWANLATANFAMGRINDSTYAHMRALRIEPGNAAVKKLHRDFASQPHMFGESAIQGAHAPARQIYMSAAVDFLKDTEPPLKILEIGSYMGASLLTWAQAARRLYGQEAEILCIDPWGDTGVGQYQAAVQKAFENQIAYEIFQHNVKVARRTYGIPVTSMRAASREALPFLASASFQLIYVDGGHYYEDALYDITECHRLLKSGGIICGDDLELQVHQCDPGFLCANKEIDFVADADGVEFHPGVTLAVAEFFGEVSVFNGFWAMSKNTDGSYGPVDFKEARGMLPDHWPGNLKELARTQVTESQSVGALIA